MNKYLKYIQNQFGQLPIKDQGIAWFISFKLSLYILKEPEDDPTYLFTFVL